MKDTIDIATLQRTLFKALKIEFPIVLIHFPPLKSGQPLYSGQISWSQCVLNEEVPLYYYVCMCTHVHMCTCLNTVCVFKHLPVQLSMHACVLVCCVCVHVFTHNCVCFVHDYICMCPNTSVFIVYCTICTVHVYISVYNIHTYIFMCCTCM